MTLSHEEMDLRQSEAPREKDVSSVRPVCLVVIDGWGLSPSSWPQNVSEVPADVDPYLLQSYSANAIAHARTPVMFELLYSGDYPCVGLDAHGEAVGLPAGLMGNSEVGHLNIGAGRIVYQDILRISRAFKEDCSFLKIPAALDVLERAKRIGRLHLLGLVSDGGVHSHIDHVFGLLDAAKAYGVPKTFVHFFADGRDTRPTSGVGFVKQLETYMHASNYGVLATIVGRYYAMDRDRRWERIQVAYETLVSGRGEPSTDAVAVGHVPEGRSHP